VLAGGASAFLSPNPAAFRSRAASPKGGEGVLVVQAPGSFLAAAQEQQGAWVVKDAGGAEISQASV